jgi:preprotein translocase subunit SecD
VIAARHLVVLAAAVMAVASCAGGSGSSASASSSRPAPVVTVTLTPAGAATSTRLSMAAEVLRNRLAALGVTAQVVVAGDALRVSGPSEVRVAVYTAEFPEVLSFREIRTQSKGTTGTPSPTPAGSGGTGPTVIGLNAPSSEPDQTAPSATTLARFAALNCFTALNSRPTPVDDDPHRFVVACDRAGQTKYLLTPADLIGTQVASASATIGQTPMGQSTGVWEVDVTFKDSAVSQVETVSRRLFNNNKQQLAITLDGVVLSAPETNGVLGANITISGGTQPFSKGEARELAGVVNGGPLPIALTPDGMR